ncbi:hypothetical protein [Persicitalea jodogahamensis]|uniref:Lipocalin-like domain-containing protein n=1 Tax=Persicitalea jodogahamensis TaxID=402147 RepID=A0A8J3D5L5_9BACT|nr:hypothetical protein [Persicitalea jodogahamensis]GHB77337.1 hypothetical protein GCM10007390_34260 [Persicitalea jodogahamensis]
MKTCKKWVVLLFVVLVAACNPAADSPETARKYLLASPSWKITEVYVNDALSYKDGKVVENFGGPVFNRYMQSVQFREDGAFVGQYEEKEEPNVLHWEIDQKDDIILVTAADSTQDNRSGWSIAPRDVRKDYFEMTTETAAFSYPNVLRIRLVFVNKDL